MKLVVKFSVDIDKHMFENVFGDTYEHYAAKIEITNLAEEMTNEWLRDQGISK